MIAPKGGEKRKYHPEFTFELENIVLACSYCNGFSKKGSFDTVVVKRNEYSKCEFNIVHPYFDDHSAHYKWVNSSKRILIESNSEKGKTSIKLFELDSEHQTLARAKQNLFENISQGQYDLLMNIMDFR